MFLLRDRFNGKLVKCLNDKDCTHSNHIGNAIKFPTSDEAEFYVSENGWEWDAFNIELAG